jgi:hypothetical protein
VNFQQTAATESGTEKKRRMFPERKSIVARTQLSFSHSQFSVGRKSQAAVCPAHAPESSAKGTMVWSYCSLARRLDAISDVAGREGQAV